MAQLAEPPRISRIGIAVSAAMLIALVAFTIGHASEARRFAVLAEHARPAWLALAFAFQLGTYACAGAIWRAVASAAGHRLRLSQLARLSVEKLSIDQLVPSGGFSGNVVVIAAMRRLGLPAALATEAIVIDILSYYAAYAVVSAAAFAVLWIHHGVTAHILWLAAATFALLAAVPSLAWWLLRHRDWQPGPRLGRVRALRRVLAALEGVSPDRVRDPKLLATAALLNLSVFLLDAATLWASLRATGTEVHVLTAFAALVVASLAGTFSLLPGGVGTFEAACTATLTLLGIPLEAALTGTLMLRGLTLWLPLVPGIALARRELAAGRQQLNTDTRTPAGSTGSA
jgi:uncharacterized protein (TIRG00374 family)